VGERKAIAARVVLLALLAALAVFTALRAWRSVTDYRTPYAFHAGLPGGPALTERVLLVVLDGVRADAAARMPSLQQLAERGSSGIVHTGVPSLSNPSRTVMVTGAWQEVNGVTNNSRYQPVPVDSLFSAARETGMPVAVAGSSFWAKAFGQVLDAERTWVHEERAPEEAPPDQLIAWQEKTCRQELEFLSRYSEGLLIVAIVAPDSAGHQFGGGSEQYRQVVAAADSCLGSLVQALDDGRTTLLITSDHGHIDLRGHGGHGGLEEEVVHVPLVIAGKAIRQSQGWRAVQIDIAPTIAMLLGLPLAATNQGSVLWQTLDVPADLAAGLREREAQQRALAASHFPDPQKIRSDERRGRSLRALAVFSSIWFAGCAIALGYRRSWLWLLAGLGAYYAAYYALFFAFGMRYSLSAINRQEYLQWFLARDLLAACAAYFLASILVLRKVEAPDARVLLDFALLAACTLALQVTWVYYQHGLFMQAVMLDLRNAFKAYLDLVQMAGLGLAAPAFALLQAILGRRRRPASNKSQDQHQDVEQQVTVGD
jgi:hypothetical protein